MKLFLCTVLVTLALGDRLENTYIPPNSARTAGGSGNFLSTPSFAGSSDTGLGEANSYIPPASGPSTPYVDSSSGQYAKSQSSHSASPQIRILKLDSENPGDGNYQFAYETENQISQHEVGEVTHTGGEQASNVVKGSYSYTAPDGQQITINYVADENGFRAEGDHIPTPPPVPVEIKKSLDLIAAAGVSQNGGYSYQDHSENSGAYEGVEIKNEATSKQYLAPSIARASQENSGATNRQYLAPSIARQGNYESINRQYLAPTVARQGGNEAGNRQYIAPSVARVEQNNQYLAPAVARKEQNNQYLAPAVARKEQSRQYLAPAVTRVEQGRIESANRQYLAPAVARFGNGKTEAIATQYLAPAIAKAQDRNEAANRQYLAPSATGRVEQGNFEAANRQYLAPSDRIEQRNFEATSRQYLAPSATGRVESRNFEALNKQYLAPVVARARQESTEATSRQYLAPAIAKATQDNGGYRY